MIIEAAIELFSEHGFRGTTTRALAEKARVTEPILYRHFPTKQDLYSAILEYKASSGLLAESAIAQQMERRDDKQVFLRLGEFVFSRYRRDPSFIRLLLFSALEGHELTQMFCERRVLCDCACVADYIKRRIEDGAFRDDVDPDMAARSFLGAIHNRALLALIFKFKDGDFEPEALLQEYVSIFLRGIEAR